MIVNSSLHVSLTRLILLLSGRMKMSTEHLVPLFRHTLELLELLKGMKGKYSLVFPSERDRAMSDSTMRRIIFKLGYDDTHQGKSKAVPHGL